MQVNMHATTSFSPHRGQTHFEVEIFVHDDEGNIGNTFLYQEWSYAQQPDEEMNLNLWATTILRGLAARMEETFVYVDHRPQAVLIQNVEMHKK